MLLLETGRIEAIGTYVGGSVFGRGWRGRTEKKGREREREKKRWSPLGGG